MLHPLGFSTLHGTRFSLSPAKLTRHFRSASSNVEVPRTEGIQDSSPRFRFRFIFILYVPRKPLFIGGTTSSPFLGPIFWRDNAKFGVVIAFTVHNYDTLSTARYPVLGGFHPIPNPVPSPDTDFHHQWFLERWNDAQTVPGFVAILITIRWAVPPVKILIPSPSPNAGSLRIRPYSELNGGMVAGWSRMSLSDTVSGGGLAASEEIHPVVYAEIAVVEYFDPFHAATLSVEAGPPTFILAQAVEEETHYYYQLNQYVLQFPLLVLPSSSCLSCPITLKDACKQSKEPLALTFDAPSRHVGVFGGAFVCRLLFSHLLYEKAVRFLLSLLNLLKEDGPQTQAEESEGEPRTPVVSSSSWPSQAKTTRLESSSPRKYKPILISHIEVPYMPKAEKAKYIGGGDSDCEQQASLPASVRPRKISRRVDSPIPPLDVEEGSDDRRSSDDEHVVQSSIAARMKSRRANAGVVQKQGASTATATLGAAVASASEEDAPQRLAEAKGNKNRGRKGDGAARDLSPRSDNDVAQVVSPEIKRKKKKRTKRKKAFSSEDDDGANPDVRVDQQVSPAPLKHASQTPLGREKPGQRTVSGIVDVFNDLSVSRKAAESYTLPPPPEDSELESDTEPTQTHLPSGGYAGSPRKRLETLYDFEGKAVYSPTEIINLSTTASDTRPFTIESAPIHHLHDYHYPDPKDIPKDNLSVIFQVGRQVSVAKAPRTIRFAGSGYIRRRPRHFKTSGIEEFISFMAPTGDPVWWKLPGDYYIPEAYILVDGEEYRDRLRSDDHLVTSWLKRIRSMFRIENVPASTDHKCRIRDIPYRVRDIEHTFTCNFPNRDAEVEARTKVMEESDRIVARSQPRPSSPSPPPCAQPRAISLANQTSSMSSFTSLAGGATAATTCNKRKKSAVDIFSSDEDPIATPMPTPKPTEPSLKRSRLYSPIVEDDDMHVEAEQLLEDINMADDDGFDASAVYVADAMDEEEFEEFQELMKNTGRESETPSEEMQRLMTAFNEVQKEKDKRLGGFKDVPNRSSRELTLYPNDVSHTQTGKGSCSDDDDDRRSEKQRSEEGEGEEEGCRPSKEQRRREAENRRHTEEGRRRAEDDRRREEEGEREERRRERADRRHKEEEREREKEELQHEKDRRREKERRRENDRQREKERQGEKDRQREKEANQREKERQRKEKELQYEEERQREEKRRRLEEECRQEEEERRREEDELQRENQRRREKDEQRRREEGRKRKEVDASDDEELEEEYQEEDEEAPRTRSSKKKAVTIDVEDEGEDDEDTPQHGNKPTKVDKGKGKAPIQPEASGSREKTVWTSKNVAKLNQAGELLHDLLNSTRLPLHLILKKLDLYIKFTRENSYSTFKRYLKLTREGPVAPFDQHAQTTAEMYKEIKAACLRQSEQAWEDQKETWKNTILTIQKGGDGSVPPDTENEEVAEYMERIISQHEVLVEDVRNSGPVDILSLVYSSHPGARTMSQFVTADPNLEDVLDNVKGSVRDFIERVVTVTDSFECGIKDPAEMTFERFQAIAIGQAGAKADKKPSKIPAQSKTKRPDPDTAVLEKIEDHRGLVERYRKNKNDVPPSIAVDSQKRWDRAQCRVFLRGLYADAVGKRDAPILIWNQNWTNALVAAKLTFYIPGEFKAIPGTGDWNPSNWKVPACKEFLEFLRDKDLLVRLEPWSEENCQLMQGDPRYKTIPIVVSSTPPKNTIKTVGDSLQQQMSDAGSAGPSVIGISDKPLEMARGRSELKKDLKASHKGNPVKDKERLNRFLESSKHK